MNALTRWYNYLGSDSLNPPITSGGRSSSRGPLDTVKDIYSIETSKKNLELKALQSIAAVQTIQAKQQQMQKTMLDEARAGRKEESDKFEKVMGTLTGLMTDPNVNKASKSHYRLLMNDMMIDAGEEDYVRLSALSKTVLRNNSEKKTEEWLSMRGPRPADLVDNSGKAITLNEDPVAVASNKFKQMEWSLGLENYTLGDKAARPMPKMVYAGDFSEKRTEGTAAIPTYAYRDELTHQIQVFRQDDMPSGVLSSAIDKGYSLSEFVRTGTVNLMNAAPSRVNLNGTYFDVTHVYDVKKGYTLQQVPVGPAPKSTGSTTWTPPKINARESTILNALNASAEDKFEKYTDKIADGLKSDAVWFERLGEVAKMSTKGVTFGLDTPKGQALLAAQIKWKDSMGGGVVPFIKPGTSKKEESFGEMLGNIFKPEENETYHYEGGEWSTIPADSYDMISVGNTDHLLWYKHSYKDEEHYWTDHQGKPKFEYFGIPPGTKLTQEQLNQHMQNRGLRYKE